METKLNYPNCLENTLQKVYLLDIALEPHHLMKKDLLMSFLTSFKEYCMSKNTLFAKYFQGLYKTGSYFQGLRVKEATEFDIIFVFKLPFHESDYKIYEPDALPSYAAIQLDSKSCKNYENILFFNKEGYLLGKNMLKWFQSLLDLYLNYVDWHYPGVKYMKSSSSGPALTVKILYNVTWISIDLVPVFNFNINLLNKLNIDDNVKTKKEFSVCFLVPKPLKPKLASCVSSHMSKQVWSIHLPEAEKLILSGKRYLKQVIKLAKALRDEENWPLSSYMIKVVAFWLVEMYPNNQFWLEIKLDSLFLLYLKALECHFAENKLKHFFYPKFNLFHSLSEKSSKNLRSRVRKIISELEKDPIFVFILFNTLEKHSMDSISLFHA